MTTQPPATNLTQHSTFTYNMQVQTPVMDSDLMFVDASRTGSPMNSAKSAFLSSNSISTNTLNISANGAGSPQYDRRHASPSAMAMTPVPSASSTTLVGTPPNNSMMNTYTQQHQRSHSMSNGTTSFSNSNTFATAHNDSGNDSTNNNLQYHQQQLQQQPHKNGYTSLPLPGITTATQQQQATRTYSNSIPDGEQMVFSPTPDSQPHPHTQHTYPTTTSANTSTTQTSVHVTFAASH